MMYFRQKEDNPTYKAAGTGSKEILFFIHKLSLIKTRSQKRRGVNKQAGMFPLSLDVVSDY